MTSALPASGGPQKTTKYLSVNPPASTVILSVGSLNTLQLGATSPRPRS